MEELLADIWRSAYRGIYILHMLKTEPVVDVVLALLKYSDHKSANHKMCVIFKLR